MTPKYEQDVINDIILLAKNVKKHLNEPNCLHDIRFIVKEALENKSAGLAAQTPTPTDIAITQKSNLSDHKDAIIS